MSALWAGAPAADERPRTPLRPVATPKPRLARFPFLLVMIGVFGLGMAGLLMLNTTLQNQAFQARALNRQATELAYVQADLERQLDAYAAPAELARRASALGMRPNPHPAFLVLPEGRVVGEPKPVSGRELPDLVVKTPAEVAAERQAARAERAAEQAAAEAKKKAAAEKAEAKKKAAAQERKKQQAAAEQDG